MPSIEQLAALTGILVPILALLWWVFQVHRTAGDAKAGVERIDEDRKEAVQHWGARLGATETEVNAVKADAQAIKSSVRAVEGRADKLEVDMRDARAALATIPVMDERLKGFEALMTSQMDEVKHGVRGLKMAVENLRPARTRAAREAE